jgi:hypothetical protein
MFSFNKYVSHTGKTEWLEALGHRNEIAGFEFRLYFPAAGLG